MYARRVHKTRLQVVIDCAVSVERRSNESSASCGDPALFKNAKHASHGRLSRRCCGHPPGTPALPRAPNAAWVDRAARPLRCDVRKGEPSDARASARVQTRPQTRLASFSGARGHICGRRAPKAGRIISQQTTPDHFRTIHTYSKIILTETTQPLTKDSFYLAKEQTAALCRHTIFRIPVFHGN